MTSRLLVTEKTPFTWFACMPAICLSMSLSTTPSSVTLPFFTMMLMGWGPSGGSFEIPIIRVRCQSQALP
jgi:hypothetical protein